MTAAYTIVVESDDEPAKRRMSVHGQYATWEDALEALPALVRDYIEPDPEDLDDESPTPEEVDAQVARIVETWDAEAFGFRVYIADLNLGGLS